MINLCSESSFSTEYEFNRVGIGTIMLCRAPRQASNH